jgi:hypothetical protein
MGALARLALIGVSAYVVGRRSGKESGETRTIGKLLDAGLLHGKGSR